jgi:bifunctional DNA-binding transcriptional regulator/antitoxin component of YhaV-PrlF toxin-antitoxin module
MEDIFTPLSPQEEKEHLESWGRYIKNFEENLNPFKKVRLAIGQSGISRFISIDKDGIYKISDGDEVLYFIETNKGELFIEQLPLFRESYVEVIGDSMSLFQIYEKTKRPTAEYSGIIYDAKVYDKVLTDEEKTKLFEE